MAQKQKKNQKFGRNRRSPSSRLQEQRTARNKRIRIERAVAAHGKKAVGHVCPKRSVIETPAERVTFAHLVDTYDFSGVECKFRRGPYGRGEQCWRERESLHPIGALRPVIKHGVTVDVSIA